MIQIYTKNALFLDTLLTALKDFQPIVYQPKGIPAPVLIICDSQKKTDEFLANPVQSSIILLGTHHEEADVELSLPCSLNNLCEQVQKLLRKRENAPDFENKTFLFEGAKRSLTLKAMQREIRLTEKETDLIIYLIKSLPNGVSKVDLLTGVWNYRADSETHTVETHIYALRQKIGEKYADHFITNTPDGYLLVQD